MKNLNKIRKHFLTRHQLPRPNEVMFLVVLACQSAGLLQSHEYICMKFLPGVCLRPKNNPSNFGDDPDYDLDYNADHTAEVCSLRLSVLF